MTPSTESRTTALQRLTRGLEPAQASALEHDFDVQGPLLLLAGAGTGKTTTLTRRLALELATGTPASQILALTFTRKAAHEMRERVATLLGTGIVLPEIRTFHSLGLSILSEHEGRGWKAAGWSVTPKLLSEDGSAFADFWQSRFRDGSCPPPSPGDWTRMLAEWGDPERLRRSTESPDGDNFRKHLDAWAEWEAWKRRLCIAEMHDLVSGALLALERDPELSASWNARSKTLFVDEYQDTDRTQYSLVKQLSGGSSRLLAVGDDDQAIYGFRGADIRNILDWKRDHPDGRILTLVGNHRSLSPILAASNRIFPDKPPEFRKILEARRPSAGRKPTWFRARTPQEELRWVRARLGDEIRHGRKPTELCVLFRGNREERPLRQALVGLPLATDEKGGISLMTIHAAKGLEWPVVVLAGQDRPIDEPGRLAPFAQDEERRLFYVACTRARDRLYLSGCDTRGSKREIRPRKPHPWMALVEPDVKIRPNWWIRLARRIWAPAARMALEAPPR